MKITSQYPVCMRLLVVILLLAFSSSASAVPRRETIRGREGKDLPITPREQTGVQLACSTLQTKLPSNAVTPSDATQYQTEIHENWSQTAWLMPGCVIEPQTAAQVASTLAVITAADALFAVRGGGHSPNVGFANIENGVLISMSELNAVVYDAETETVAVGAGAVWDDVYTALAPLNRTVVGGRYKTVGVGGYTLGGGLSHFSNEHGLAIEQVIQYEVVLANSTIVNVTATSHADLFWALKGGSSNFGIATQYIYKTISIGDVWGGVMYFSSDNLRAVASAIVEYGQKGILEQKSAILPYLPVNNDTMAVILFYASPVDRPACFEPFYAIPTIEDTTAVQSWISFIGFTQDFSAIPRWLFRATTIVVDEDLFQETVNITIAESQKVLDVESLTFTINVQPISSSLQAATTTGAVNLSGSSATPKLWLCITVGYFNEADDERVEAAAKNTTDQIVAAAQQRGLSDDFIYLNDAYADQNVLSSYGKGTIERLRAIAVTYDPQGVFQKLLPGGFKLSR